MTALVLGLCAASSLLTTAWHRWVTRSQERRSHQQLCHHPWTEAMEVAPPGLLGPRTRFYKRFCPACGKQEDVNQDGSPYVPRSQRKD